MAWHVAVGDEVALNQVLVEVETEKAVVELPSPFAGTVVELLAAAGETVAVGAPLVAIDSAGDAGADEPTASEPDATPRRRCRCSSATARPRPPPSRRRRSGSGAPRPPAPAPTTGPERRGTARWPRHRCASWRARTGVDLADVTGHGPGGIITREDLAAHLARRRRHRAARGTARPSRGDARTRARARRPEAHGRGHGPQRGRRRRRPVSS